MSQMLKRFAIVRMGKTPNRCKDHNTAVDYWQNASLNKERDKLLQEFLLAREELKAQFDIEKREIIVNYERRNRYLRKLLEECNENINMLKLNLDGEKEQNFILRTKLMELERECSNQQTNAETPAGYLNQSYEDESTLSYDEGTLSDDCEDTFLLKDKSSLSGLKYSDKSNSIDSIAKSSLTSVTYMSDTDDNIHHNCREEFSRLLKELRTQQKKYDEQLKKERDYMEEQLDNEKLQVEKVVFKQLNLKLEKEIKKRELLLTEHAHLQKTLSHTIIESIVKQNQGKHSPLKVVRKETNSDSGADVEDNRSDDGSDVSQHTTKRMFINEHGVPLTHDAIISSSVISKIIQEQKVRLVAEFQKQILKEKKKFKRITESLNSEIVALVKENRALREQSTFKNSCFEEVSDFHCELTKKLITLEELLTDDPDAC